MKRVISFLLVLVIISSVGLTSCNTIAPCQHDDPNNIFIISAKESNCTNTGLTEGVKCGYCGTMILPQKEIPTNDNHSFTDWIVVGEPEPDEAKVEKRHCMLCSKIEERITYPSIDETPDDMEYDPIQEVTITFYHSMGSAARSILDKYIEKFNELYPNIHVEHQSWGDYDAVYYAIRSKLPVGNQPNIAFSYPEHVAEYIDFGKAMALDDYIDHKEYGLSEQQRDDFIDYLYNEGREYGDGTNMYTLPFSKSTELLYYNKTFFEEHNLRVPTTWDEMEEICAEIKRIDPDCVPLGYDDEATMFITLCEQLGSPYASAVGDHYLFDNETNRAFVKRFTEWYKKGYIVMAEILQMYTSGLFSEQQIYMSIGSSAGARYHVPTMGEEGYPFEVGIATIPQVDPADPKVISMGPSLVMLDSGNEQENMATWLFMKFLTTDAAFQAEYSMSIGYMPVIESVMEIESYVEYLNKMDGDDNIMALAIMRSLEQKDAYFRPVAFVGSKKSRDAVGNILLYSMVNGSLPSVTDLDAVIDAAFKEAMKYCTE